MQSDLNRLHIFYHIYRLNSVSRAAAELRLSQPAVSQHLRKLEEELRVQLFTRIHKKLVATSAGRQLFESIEPFLTTLPDVLQNLRHPADVPYGLLRLGAPYEFGQVYLPDICHVFHQQYPEVRFSVTLGESTTILEQLHDGVIDLAVIDLVLDQPRNNLQDSGVYSVIPLINEDMTLICSNVYYDQEINGDHSYENLITKSFISDEHNNMFIQHWFNHHFKKAAAKPNIVITVESHQANLRCAKLGMGLTVTASHMVWKDITEGKVIPITTDTQNAINTISMVQLLDKVPTITEKTFQNHIRDYMQQNAILERFTILPST